MNAVISVLLSIFIALAASQEPSLSPGSGSCLPLVVDDLGSTTMRGMNEQPFGIVRSALSVPELGPPEVVILDFNIVCESAGLTRDTASSVSVVVTFECTGSSLQCAGGGAGPVNLTQQFTFRCAEIINLVTYEPLFIPVPFITRTNPVASLDTLPDTQCGLCLDPSNGMPVDDVTHCIGE
jgi:hypothetical protein